MVGTDGWPSSGFDSRKAPGPRTAGRSVAACLLAFFAVFQSGCLLAPQEKLADASLNDVLRTAAVEAEGANDYRKAVRHFRTLYERDRTDPAVVRDLARNMRYAGDPRNAAAFLTENLKTVGRKPELVLELAKAQLVASRLDDAHRALTEAQSLMPENWQLYSAWGVYHDRRGNFDQARDAYQRALGLSPNNFAVLNNLALSLALAGRIDEGISTLRKLAESEKTTSQVRQNLALLYGIKGDLESAERLAREDLPQESVERNLSTWRHFHE